MKKRRRREATGAQGKTLARSGKHNANLIAKSVPAASLAPALDFVAIQQYLPPPFSSERDQLCSEMDSYVRGSLRDLLSDSDREVFSSPGAVATNEKASCRILAALDRVILDRAPSLGPLLFLSSTVQDRLLQWRNQESQGPELLAKLGKQLSRGAKARQGKGKLPVETWHASFKKQIVPELKALQRLLRSKTSATTMSPKELTQEIARLVQRTDSPFSGLQQNWSSFEQLTRLEPDKLATFSRGTFTPTLFADLWITKVVGSRSQESTRQALSDASRKLRTSTL
jgi:hypothetical protein